MSSRRSGRHRAAVPTTSTLSALVDLAGVNAGTVGRRAAVITASSGLVVSMGVTVADAAPVTTTATDGDPVTAAQPVLDTAKLAELDAIAQAAAATAPVVTVAADAAIALDQTSLTAATPPPPPPPPPVEERTTSAASRSTTRTAVTTEAVSQAPVNAEGIRAEIIATANRYLGIPYRYGGTTPSGFDCSGFTSYVFAQVGISLPRTSGSQAGAGTRVSASEAQPGDLVYQPGHVAIYAGNGMMIDSPSSGGVTSVRSIWMSNPQFIRVL